MNKKEKCNGVVVPMISPFTVGGQIDTDSAARITEHLIENDCAPFILGTTGEATSISGEQKIRLANAVVEKTKGRKPVFAGISSTCFEETVNLAHQFSALGVNYLVAHLPFFYPLKPGQMKEYFTRLADVLKSPLILYNIPATTHMSLPPDVIFELSEHQNILAIKDSERDVSRLEEIAAFCNKSDFSHLIGWGAQITYALSIGSDGLVPSTGNIVPGMYSELYQAAANRDFSTANRLQTETDYVSAIYQKDRSLGESLAALKVMMKASGLCGKQMLSPLTQLPSNEEQQILEKFKLLKQHEQVKQIREQT